MLAVVGVVAVLAVVVVVFPTGSAQAVTCGAGEGVVGWESGFGTRYGVRVVDPGMDINVANPPDCIRVGSLYVIEDDLDFVEVGWYVDTIPTACSNGGQSNPHMLMVKHYNGTEYCKNNTVVISEAYHGFTLSNVNHDFTWNYYLDGAFQGSYTTLLNQGFVQSGAERHGSTDGAYDDFDGLKVLNAAWGNWSNSSSTGSSSATGWVYCYYSHVHTASKQTGAC